MKIHLRLMMLAKNAPWSLVLTVILGFCGGLLTILQAHFLSSIISDVFLGGKNLSGVSPLLQGLLGIILLRAAASFGSDYSASLLSIRIKKILRNLLYQRLLALGPAYVQGEHSGELTATVIQGTEALDAYFSQYLPQIVLAAVIPISILATVFPLDLLSGMVFLFTAPLIPLFMYLIGKYGERLTGRQWKALQRMSAYFLDTLQGLTALKILGQSENQAGRIAAVSERYRTTTLQVMRVTFLSALALELISTLSTAVIAVEIGLRLLYGQFQFEQAFFILVIAPDFYLPLRLLGQRFHAGMTGVSAARRIFEILDQPEPPLPAATNVSFAASNLAGKKQTIPLLTPGEINFDQVSFTYPNRPREAVRDVSFTLSSGTNTVLIGHSGAGKSTILYLLLRFYQPDRGSITWNGIPIQNFALEVWRKVAVWVPQKPHLFHDTIAANIRLGCPDASLEKVVEASRLAHLDDFIRSLPQGYDTPIGEQGANLSGGQAQRLALARAFLVDAPLLILDEPTAHLDSEQDALIQQSIQSLRQHRTVLTIAHRLSGISSAQQLLVMENGTIIEQGTPAQLQDANGAFSRFLRTSLEKA